MEVSVVKVVKEDIKYLYAYITQSYWDGAEISKDGGNTFEDVSEDGNQIPDCMFIKNDEVETGEKYFIKRTAGEKIFPLYINVDTGRVENWPIEAGVSMRLYWKVRDEGLYQYKNADKVTLHEIYDYVPDEMCIGESNDGDYVIMNIDSEGNIDGWNGQDVADTLKEITWQKFKD